MTDTLMPINAAASGDPKYAARAARQTLVGVPLSGATAARPLGVRSGVRPGTPSTTATVALSGTTPTWTVNPHAGVIDAQASAAAGAYEYAFDAVKSGSLAAQDSTNARRDLLCVQVSDTDEDQSGLRKVDIVSATGTANGSLALPTVPDRSMPIVVVNVPKAGGGNPTVTWIAPVSVAAGGVVPVSSSAELLALPKFPGAYADLIAATDGTTLGLYHCADGANWTLAVGDTGWITPSSMVGGTGTGGAGSAVQYRKRNGVVYMTGFWVPSTNSEIQFRLPAGFRPLNTLTFWCERGSSNGPGAKMEVQQGTGSVIYRLSPSGGTGAVNYAPIVFPADA